MIGIDGLSSAEIRAEFVWDLWLGAERETTDYEPIDRDIIAESFYWVFDDIEWLNENWCRWPIGRASSLDTDFIIEAGGRMLWTLPEIEPIDSKRVALMVTLVDWAPREEEKP